MVSRQICLRRGNQRCTAHMRQSTAPPCSLQASNPGMEWLDRCRGLCVQPRSERKRLHLQPSICQGRTRNNSAPGSPLVRTFRSRSSHNLYSGPGRRRTCPQHSSCTMSTPGGCTALPRKRRMPWTSRCPSRIRPPRTECTLSTLQQRTALPRMQYTACRDRQYRRNPRRIACMSQRPQRHIRRLHILCTMWNQRSRSRQPHSPRKP